MSKKLMEVRDQFSKVLNDPAHLNASSREIASAFLASHSSTISIEAWNEVTITGLIHIMDGLRRRRRPPSEKSIGTLDLFAGFKIEPIIVVRVNEDGKGIVDKNKDLPSLTLPEAMDYLARHDKDRETNTKRVREWRRLIARVKPFMTREGMTLSEGMMLAHAADTKKKHGRG
jgi:hypothetical protein